MEWECEGKNLVWCRMRVSGGGEEAQVKQPAKMGKEKPQRRRRRHNKVYNIIAAGACLVCCDYRRHICWKGKKKYLFGNENKIEI
jgi:hypothetical protein